MKIVFLIVLHISAFLGFCQGYIEVKLVNPNVGAQMPYQNISNDAGLNSILTANNVFTYESKCGNPFDNSPRYINVYNGSNEFSNSTLLTQLQNYSSVIESAVFCSYTHFNNMLTIKLVTNNTGAPTGLNGNIVTTNDANLNQIFQDYNIVEIIHCYPNFGDNLNRFYHIRSSNCNLENLKIALQNHNTVIQLAENIPAAYLLANESFENKNTKIYPNPFQNELHIETDKTILNYKVVDISGKTISNATTKTDFENSISQLNNGLYIVQLNYDDGSNSSHKIVKN